MKKALFAAMTLLILTTSTSASQAATMRYALIIGNNSGLDGDGNTPFAPLRYAEKEAKRLKKKLVGLSNFAADSKRTLLLTAATRQDVRNAVNRLARQKKNDEQMLGEVESIFLFYFTGHGLQGRLLLNDGPLYSSEIGNMFERVDADFAVGVFDACHSGSLSPKGVVSTPGFNMFNEMPKEVLNARGRVWYVSSSAQQMSYEDTQIGGVFTHFFIKALTDAPRNGPGITLESIWNFAREKTVQFTRKQNRTQEPQQYISELKSSAPVYFSFPLKRTATLRMSRELRGRYALSYAQGQLTEIIDKKSGVAKSVALYSGKVTLSYIQGETVTLVKTFHVEDGGDLILRSQSDLEAAVPLAYQSETLWAKGTDDLQMLELRRKTGGTSMLLGGSYGYSFAADGLLTNGHIVSMPIRLDFKRLYLASKVGWVGEDRDTGVWGYDADSVVMSVEGGPAFDIYSNRITVGPDFEYMHLWQEFNDETRQQSDAFSLGAKATWLFHKDRRFNASFFVRAGEVYAKAAAASNDYFWGFCMNAGLTLFVRLI
ncbi:MAG: caspase family protein [Deltaproteobacteria bacterium]|nr:caspase family protein [Deltaproteobacteria bacterium]